MESPLSLHSLSLLPPSTSSQCSLKAYRCLASQKEDTVLTIKSKFGAEFRRFSLSFASESKLSYVIFAARIFNLHGLTGEKGSPTSSEGIVIEYIDPADSTTLPINNDDTLRVAVSSQSSILRIFLQRRGESNEEEMGYGLTKAIMRQAKKRPSISAPQDFRRVSAIVDVDVLPNYLRRVQLCKYKSNLPLGFYIRDGISYRNLFPQPGIFVSRLVDHGIAASTNLLHANDEILEVNGIDVTGKTLDQVTDIMIANSFNLILTVRPGSITVLPSPPTYSSPSSSSGDTSQRGKRMESGLRSYFDITSFGVHDSLENTSPYPLPSYAFPPSLPNPAIPPPYSNLSLHPSVYGSSPSFSRNTTVRLSDKLRQQSPLVISNRPRRPFSLYAPNLH